MSVPLFTNINPDVVKKAKEKYKGWSREKLFETAIAVLHPGCPRSEGTLQVEFTRAMEINEGSFSKREPIASLVEIRSWLFSVLIHEFTPEESRVIRAQKIYWEMAQKFRSPK